MEKYSITAQKRTLLGRKVKSLRRRGVLPANVYGKKVDSVSIELPLDDFEKIYKKAGVTGLVELTVSGKVHPVLIHNIQYDPVTMDPIHVDFYHVDLREKVTAKVPVVLIGDAPAVSGKVGVLLTLLDEIEVEALPADLPDKIEISVGNLSTVDQTIKVADIQIASLVKIVTPGDRDVVKVAPLVSKAAEKLAAEEEAAKAAAAAASVPEGEAPVASTPPGAVSEGPTPQQAEGKKEEAAKPKPPKA